MKTLLLLLALLVTAPATAATMPVVAKGGAPTGQTFTTHRDGYTLHSKVAATKPGVKSSTISERYVETGIGTYVMRQRERDRLRDGGQRSRNTFFRSQQSASGSLEWVKISAKEFGQLRYGAAKR